MGSPWVRRTLEATLVGAAALLVASLLMGTGTSDAPLSGTHPAGTVPPASGTPDPAPPAPAEPVADLSGSVPGALPETTAPPPRPAPEERGRLAIVIDDIGWERVSGGRVIALPGPLTLAVLPGTPVGEALSRQAHAAGHEIVLHQPMAAHSAAPLGPGALEADAGAAEITRIVAANLDALPHSVGISNHMGSLLTSRSEAMGAVMAAAAPRSVYFLDSRTTAETVALKTARAFSIPSIRRDVFLDAARDPASVDAALEAALVLAETRGHAVAIGHPYPVTLEILEQRMEEIRERVRLVPVSALVNVAGGRQQTAAN